jgi:hypothetical protein
MRPNAFLPQGHIRDRRLGQEREISYRHRKNSQANSELRVETFSKAADYRNRTIEIRRPLPTRATVAARTAAKR